MNGFFKKFDDFLLEKARYIIAPDGMLAAETWQVWNILARPLDALLGVGNGNLLAGIGWCYNKAKAIKKPWHNLMMLSAAETVGAAATFSIRFKVWQPFLLTGIGYKNDTTDTGALTTLKVNGELVMPRGLTTEDTLGTYDITDTFANDSMDIIFIVPAGSEIEVNGTATNGDTVTVCLYGYDLDLQRVD